MPDEQNDAATTPPSAPAPKKRGKKQKKPKKKYDSMLGYLWGEWIRPLGLIFIVMGLFRLTAFDWFDVPTGSMEPTILVGDRIAVHKWTYGLRVPFTKDVWIAKWGRPNRGDIVVCYSPDRGDEVRLVKRIVAQPGDTIEMVDGRLVINGEPAEYADLDESFVRYLDPVDRTIEVPDGQYVMIGDNRDNSKDSRAWNLTPDQWGKQVGFIGHERIQGRAFAVAFSLDKENYYMPRWGRFFKGLD